MKTEDCARNAQAGAEKYGQANEKAGWVRQNEGGFLPAFGAVAAAVGVLSPPDGRF